MSDQGKDAWSHYWHAARLDSCIAGNGAADEADIRAFWHNLLDDMRDGAHIIDLACGNGAVSLRLAEVAGNTTSMKITAVDIADIDPERFLAQQHPAAGTIDFCGNTDITNLPFSYGSFDAAVSQFGFEYADREAAAREMMRILVPGGKFQLLMHHQEGALVAPNIAQIGEIDLLLAAGAPVDRIIGFLGALPAEQDTALHQLETAGKTLIQHHEGKPPRITQEIFAGINQLIERQDLSFDMRLCAAEDMRSRLQMEKERMLQLSAAALSEECVQEIANLTKKCGADNVSFAPFYLGEDKALLGWSLRGIKG